MMTVIRLLEKKAPGLVKRLVSFRAKLSGFDQFKTRRKISQLLLETKRLSFIQQSGNSQWIRAFKAYLNLMPRNLPIFQSFIESDIQVLQQSDQPLPASEPIVVCVVKNDLERLKMVLTHHRQLGFERFAIVDNNSTDDSLVWLKDQPDVDLYQITEPFKSQKKYGWINRILALYGFDRWYLYVDSDELFVYPGCEKLKIQKTIELLETKSQNRLATILLDMYSDQNLFAQKSSSLSIQEQFPYFDTDSFVVEPASRGLSIKGGPRKRVFSSEEQDSPQLVKYPLFKLEAGMIFESAHYLFPFQQTGEIEGALLHYKFLDNDLERYRQIAQNGSFQGGSREYKRYIEKLQQNPQLNFYYNGSACYEHSGSLLKLKFMKTISGELS